MLIDTLDIATENGLVRIGGENGGGDGKRHSLGEQLVEHILEKALFSHTLNLRTRVKVATLFGSLPSAYEVSIWLRL